MWAGTQWQNPTLGTLNSSANTVTVAGVNNSAPWTLKENDVVPNDCNLAIPNAFSPNGDGHSDLFILQGWSGCVVSFSIRIFDRWGENVFETKNPEEGWDGTYKGKPLNAAVFVYYIKATSLTGKTIIKRGNISLIR